MSLTIKDDSMTKVILYQVLNALMAGVAIVVEGLVIIKEEEVILEITCHLVEAAGIIKEEVMEVVPVEEVCVKMIELYFFSKIFLFFILKSIHLYNFFLF